jgi:hypothetical protein
MRWRLHAVTIVTGAVGCSALAGLDKNYSESPCFPAGSSACDAGADVPSLNTQQYDSGDDASVDGPAQVDGPPETDCAQACASGCLGDVHNCGACGHSCQGGDCDWNVCQPVTLATEQGYPWTIVVDPTGTSVYWTNDVSGSQAGSVAGVMKVPVTGGSVTIVSNGGASFGLAVTPANVYWTHNQVFYETGGESDTFASGPASLLAADTTSLYWTGGGSLSSSTSGVIATKAFAMAGANVPAVTLASGQNTPCGIAVDSSNVYWADSANGTVVRVPKSSGGGGPTTLASGQVYPQYVAVDSSNVYWTNAGGVIGEGTIMKVELETAAVATVASLQSVPTGIAVDSSNIYWTNLQSGAVMVAPVDGGAPTTLASGPWGALGITLDSTCVYWTTKGFCPSDGGTCTGTIMKVAKRGP